MPEVKYYQAEIFNDNDEISLSEAISLGSYVTCYFSNKSLKYAESFSNGEISKIVYYNQAYPSHSLLENHLILHKDFPFDVISLLSGSDGKSIFEIVQCSKVGQVEAITELSIDQQGNYLSEAQMDANKNLYGKTEYEYSQSGDLILVRELGSDGKILTEYHPDLD
jgi:hypothetical protein